MEVMFVTVWWQVAPGYMLGTEEAVAADCPLCDLRVLFPGCESVVLSGDDVQRVSYTVPVSRIATVVPVR